LISSHADGFTENTEGVKKGFAELRKLIADAAITSDLSRPDRFPEALLVAIGMENDENFADLIQFFKSRSRRAQIIYTSMTMAEENGTRLGIERVLAATLP
jgi:hypothetical protein